KENEDLLNIVEEKNKIIKNKEEKIDDFNNRVFYYSDFFGKILISLKKDINKKNFFQLSMTLLKKIYISIQKHQYLLHLYLVLKKKILLKKILLKKIIFGKKVAWMNGKKIIVLFLTIGEKVTKIIMINYIISYFF